MNSATATRTRQTTLGGAYNTVKLKQMFPETTGMSLDYYLLSKPISLLLTCNDPAVTTREAYVERMNSLGHELSALAEQMKAFV